MHEQRSLKTRAALARYQSAEISGEVVLMQLLIELRGCAASQARARTHRLRTRTPNKLYDLLRSSEWHADDLAKAATLVESGVMSLSGAGADGSAVIRRRFDDAGYRHQSSHDEQGLRSGQRVSRAARRGRVHQIRAGCVGRGRAGSPDFMREVQEQNQKIAQKAKELLFKQKQV